MELSTRATSKMAWEKDQALNSGPMVPGMSVSGTQTKQTEMANFGMLMEMFTKEPGLMTKLMDSERTHIRMVRNMKETGWTISRMETVLRLGLIVANTKATTRKEWSTVVVFTSGPMALPTTVSGLRTKSTGTGTMNGPMAVPSKESGRTTTCTVRVPIPGRTVASTMEST